MWAPDARLGGFGAVPVPGVRPGIGRLGGSMRPMDRPPPDPAKLLAYWMEWERGETTPGKVLSNLKTAGLPDLLRQLAGQPGTS